MKRKTPFFIGQVVLLFCLVYGDVLHAQSSKSKMQVYSIEVEPVNGERKVNITADGKPFTAFIYSDTLEKSFLYPIYAPDGQLITRGFPFAPRKDEPTDHPHHTGLWLNYESVNGFDF